MSKLTMDEWRAMSERERDAVVAERVVGEVVAHAPIYDGLTRTDDFHAPTLAEVDEAIKFAYPVSLEKGQLWPAQYCGPEYTTDISAAWEVVEKMEDRDILASLTRRKEYDAGDEIVWVAELRECVEPWGRWQAWAATTPEAIVLAALRAVGALE